MKSQPLHFHPVIFRNLQAHFKNEPAPAFFDGDWKDFRKIYASSAIFPYGTTPPEANYKPARLYVVVTQMVDGQLKRLLGSPWSLPTDKPQVNCLLQNTLFNYMLVAGLADYMTAQQLEFRSAGPESIVKQHAFLSPQNSFLGVEFSASIDVYFQLHLPENIQLWSKGEPTPGICWGEPPQEQAIHWARRLSASRDSAFSIGSIAPNVYLEHFMPTIARRPANEMRRVYKD